MKFQKQLFFWLLCTFCFCLALGALNTSAHAASVGNLIVQNETWEYNGETHIAAATLDTVATVAGYGSIQYSTDNGKTWKDTAPNKKNAGTVNVLVKAISDSYDDLTGSYTLTVTKKPLTVQVTAVDREYQKGQIYVQLTGYDLIGVVDGDDVYVGNNAGINPMYDDSIGNNKPVQMGELKLSGADAGNYTLIQPTVTVNITKVASNGSLVIKKENGGNVALDGYNLSKVYDGEPLSIDASSISVLNVPTSAKYTVTLSGENGTSITNAGIIIVTATATSETYADVTATFTLTVTLKELTPVVIAVDRPYVAGNIAVTVNIISVSGKIGNDDVSIVQITSTGTMDDDSVGNGKPVTVPVTGLMLTGAAAGNYALIQPTTVTVNITEGSALGGPTGDILPVLSSIIPAAANWVAAVADKIAGNSILLIMAVLGFICTGAVWFKRLM